MSVIRQTDAVSRGLKELSFDLQNKTDAFRKVNDQKRLTTQSEIKKFLTEEDFFHIVEELRSMNSKISVRTIGDVLNIKSDTFSRLFKSGQNKVLGISDSKKSYLPIKDISKDKKSAIQEKEEKDKEKEEEISLLKLLEAIKNLDQKITFLFQELTTKIEEE
jgi:hypothetical protein